MATREASIDIAAAQDEMRSAYLGGAPGVVVSGLVWLAAAIVGGNAGPRPAFAVLFVGGMAIFPASAAVARAFGAPPVAAANPLNRLGLETTIPLFAALLIAFRVLPADPAFAFALFAVIVGARYFAFATIYGDRAFWLLGGAIAAIGTAFMLHADRLPLTVTAWVAAAEIVGGGALYVRWRRRG